MVRLEVENAFRAMAGRLEGDRFGVSNLYIKSVKNAYFM
jgi:hypothetical protein